MRILARASFVLAVLAQALAASAQSGAVWFDSLPREGAPLREQDLADLTRFVADELKQPRAKVPQSLEGDLARRIVFVSSSDGRSAANVATGTGRGVTAAAREACGKLKAAKAPADWVKIDLVRDVTPLEQRPGGGLDLEPSLEGLAFSADSGLALLPEELLARGLLVRGGAVRRPVLIDYVAQRQSIDPRVRALSAVPAFRFTTQSSFVAGGQVVPIYRGHRVVKRVDGPGLLDAARLAGDYLVRTSRPDGRFLYEYHPLQGPTLAKYNILRHAGTTYSLAELYEATGDERYKATAEKAIEFLLSRAVPERIDDQDVLVVLDDEDQVKLGGNALAVVALCRQVRATGDRSRLETIRKMARWIVSCQDENGRFTTHIKGGTGGGLTPFESLYYPGEAILALLRLYQIDPDPLWLDAAEKGAAYLIEVRDRGLSDRQLPHDHWLLYGLNDLYRLRKRPLFLDHALRLARVIGASQIRTPMYPDWLGGFDRPPRSNPTATRTEGLCAAYALARDFGHAKQAEEILVTVRRALCFQLQTQWRPESVMYFPDPQLPLGGFHETLTDFDTRIDHVQHNLSALLAARAILETNAGDEN